MKTIDNNPPSNVLGPGITEDSLKSAISNSGYPLQTIVADYIRTELNAVLEWPYSIQQEWAYIDKDTGEHRAIDIFAVAYLTILSLFVRYR